MRAAVTMPLKEPKIVTTTQAEPIPLCKVSKGSHRVTLNAKTIETIRIK